MARLGAVLRQRGYTAIAVLAACARTGGPGRPPAPVAPVQVRSCQLPSRTSAAPDSLTIVVADALPGVADTASLTAAAAARVLAPALAALGRATRCMADSPQCHRRLPCEAAVPLVVQRAAGDAARDAIDAGADVVVTRNPAAVAYAATRHDLESIPLGWDRVYVLLLPAGHGGTNVSTADSGTAALAALQSALVADVVRTESRPAEWQQWQDADARCAPGSPPGPTGAVARTARLMPRLVYPRSDSVARSLGERLAAIARTDSASPLGGVTGSPVPGSDMRAVGLLPSAFAQAVAAGADAGYVLDLPADSATACQRRVQATAMAPWVARGDAGAATQLLPLIETRARAIVRSDAAQRIVDQLGSGRPDSRGRAEP